MDTSAERTWAKGPWRFDEPISLKVTSQETGRSPIVCSLWPTSGDLQWRANGYLIAASPELYDAGVELAKAAGVLLGWPRDDKPASTPHEQRVELMAAIHRWDRIAAQARGEQP